MDKFFTQKYCDRCFKPLNGGRIMSFINTDCLCMNCAKAERQLSRFKESHEAEIAEVRRGNYNFPGIGF